MTRPMQPPASQPIGFWTVRAGEAIRARIRSALAEVDVTQPEWWVLHQLSLHPDGVERAAVVDVIDSNDTPAVIEEAIDAGIARGRIHADGTVLRWTDSGAAAFARAVEVQKGLREERMQGITVDEYATTISVLQRTIANVGGEAWHW
ncbi:MarR family winged helix-turn-helix transcriptional regulator [Pseudonocardia sp. CA-107938]|uniref:MarR family winged helix-turn-helix transcriptional regulator n=1 Tax=Pseudonocardia sp. CA-107938 TaxID=3240021 RepID=UPI003D912686